MLGNNVKAKIADAFGSASCSYDLSARLQRYSGQILLNNLTIHQATKKGVESLNKYVLDLGAGTGYFSELLHDQGYQVLGLDLSKSMLNFAKTSRDNNITWLNADVHQLPLKDNSVDIIFSNLMIQWCNPLSAALAEIKRVLKPGGIVVISTLLDGTLAELKQSWSCVDNDEHVLDFKELNTIESTLDKSGLSIVKQDHHNVVLDYQSVKHLAVELKSLGANHVPNKKNKGLAGKSSWQKMTRAYEEYKLEQGLYPATYNLYTAMLLKSEVKVSS